MQERGRESGGRRNRSHSSRRSPSRSSSKRSESKPRNFVELRNRTIEETKKKSLKNIEKKSPQPKPKKTALIKKKLPVPIVVPSSRKSQRSLAKSSTIGAPKSNNILQHKTEADPQFLSFAIAAIVAVGLILVSSLDLLFSEGMLWIYLGLILLKKPSLYSRGRYLDWIAFGVIAYASGACLFKLPFFYSDWRVLALESYGLNFGLFNSITPDASFEAWLRVIACTALFYHIGQWKLNNSGRHRFFTFIIGLAISLVFIDRFLGRTPFSSLIPAENLFTPIQGYMDNMSVFLLIAAVVAWGLFFDTYLDRHKRLLASFCLVGLSIILIFLIAQKALLNLSLFFLAAYALLIRMWIKRNSGFYRYSLAALPGVLFSLWLYLNPKLLQSLGTVIVEPLSAQFLEFKQVASAQLETFSFLGNGIATANTLLPQYTETNLYAIPLAVRNFDLLYFLNDFGLLGVSALLIGLLYWIWKGALPVRGSQKGLIFVSSLILFIFLLQFLYGTLSISLGLILLVLVFYDLSLRGNRVERSPRSQLLGKKACRLIGVFSVLTGFLSLWVSAFNLPVHSEVRYRLGMGTEKSHGAIQDAILYQDFSPNPSYLRQSNPNTHLFEAAQAIRSGKPFSEVKATLHRSSFLNPNYRDHLLDWGYLIEAYDLNQATDIWYAYFAEDPQDRLSNFKKLLYHAVTNYELILKLKPVAQLSQNYSIEYIKFLNKIDFQRFFQIDLQIDFLTIDQVSRFQLMRLFLEYGMFEVFESYQSQYQEHIHYFFILEAIKEKELANFDRALQILRNNIRTKSFGDFKAKPNKKYIPRVFFQKNPDLEMGTILVQKAVEAEAYFEALQYIDHLLTLEKPPLYVQSWRAELLYRIGNLVESWFAYMTYIDAAKVRHMFNQSHNNH